MAPKRVNYKCGNIKSGFIGLAMVDSPTHNPIYGNKRHSSILTNTTANSYFENLLVTDYTPPHHL